eukprot:IDg15229t1
MEESRGEVGVTELHVVVNADYQSIQNEAQSAARAA